MKFRMTLIAVLAVLVASFGAVAAQHGTDHSTPEASDHSDHADHGDAHGDHDSGTLSLGAFYITITNNGDDADTLVMVETDMADVVEIHNVEMRDGVMTMFPMEEGVEVPAGETVVFEPGSYHVMLIGITESLLEGDEFTATLHFEHAGEVEITVPIFALEPDEDDQTDPVVVGDLEVSNIWARQAPKLEGSATPVATPDATPGS